MKYHIYCHCEPPQAARQSRKLIKILDCFATLAMTIFLFSTTIPAHAQNAEKRPEHCAVGLVLPAPERVKDASITKICTGTVFEPFETAKANPVRKGLGTTDPQATLDVNGGVKIGNDTAPCTAQKAGTLRFTGQGFEGCNGKSWVSLQTEKGQ